MDRIHKQKSSLTKSFYFFLTSVFQSVALFSFFWQRPESTFPMRDVRVFRFRTPKSRKRSEEEQVTDNEMEFLKHLGPLEKTIEQLTEKMSSLNSKIEGTLQGHQTDGPPTATLKSKLKTCILQIATLLNEIDAVSAPPELPDSAQWEEERKKLTEKRLELEKRLNMRKNEEKEERAGKKFEQLPSITAAKSSKDQRQQNDIREIAAQVHSQIAAENDDDSTAGEEAAFLESLKGKPSFSKVIQRGEKNDPRKLSVGSKRTQREIGTAHSMFSDRPNVDEGGHQSKKQKSISKAKGSSFPLSTWEEPDADAIDKLDARSLLSKLNDISNAKSSDGSSEESTGEESESESSEKKEKEVPEDLMAALNKLGGIQSAPPSVSKVSKDDLLTSLLKPQSSESSEDESASERSEEGSEAEESIPVSKKVPEKIFADPKNKDSTKELIAILNAFKKEPKETTTKPTQSSSVKSKSTKLEKSSTRSPAATLKASSSGRTKSKRKKSVDQPESDAPPPSLAAMFDMPGKKPGSLRVKVKSPSRSSKDVVKSGSKEGKSEKSDRSASKEKERSKVGRNVSITTDLLPGGSTFEVLRKLNQFKEGAREESSESESQPQEKSETESCEPDAFDPLTCDLITAFGVREEMNKQGLIRGKKGFHIKTKSKNKKYQMEDTNFCAFPFNKSKEVALFCVFDGHAGKECSTELTTAFPRIFLNHWTQQNKDRKKIDISKVWTDVYHDVDEHLKKFEDEGSTATTVLVWRANDNKRYLQCANVGDSTAILCRENRALLLSQDHKPTVNSERKRIELMGIPLEPSQTRLNGLAVSRAFGDHFAKSVECGIIAEPYLSNVIEITPKDTRVIIASDGLWDVISGQRACDIVKSVKDPSLAAKKLVQTAVKSNKCNDNVTVVVVNLR